MKTKKIAKEKLAKVRGGYQTSGRRGSANIEDRRPGATGSIAGVPTLPDSTSSGSSSGNGANRERSGRGSSV